MSDIVFDEKLQECDMCSEVFPISELKNGLCPDCIEALSMSSSVYTGYEDMEEYA